MTNKAETVFVVHGRDLATRDAMFAFLRALGLKPMEWDTARALTGEGSPFIGEIVESALPKAQCVVVLLTPDDEVRLRPDFLTELDPPDERELSLQPRPNVFFEAGFAFGRDKQHTILLQFGQPKLFSDISGRHLLQFDGSPKVRERFRRWLEGAGCAISAGTDYLTVGDFKTPRSQPISGSNASTLPRGTQSLDGATFQNVFHDDDDHHDLQVLDTAHRYTAMSFSAVVDGLGNYYGIYERHGSVDDETSDGLVIHAAASGQSPEWPDLGVIAFDLDSSVPLATEVLEEKSHCKVWKIRFPRVLQSGESFRIRWMFQWARSMRPSKDDDAINLRLMRYRPRKISFALQLPARATQFNGYVRRLGDWSVSGGRASAEVEDSSRRVYRYNWAHDLGGDDDGVMVSYTLHARPQAGYPPLRRMVDIGPATPADLSEAFLLEIAEEHARAATLVELHARRAVYPDGVVVARAGGHVIGYFTACRWHRTIIHNFEEITPFSRQHVGDGPYLYVNFINVAPPFRNRGVGSELIDEVLRLAERERVRAVQLVAKADLREFYGSRGFVAVQELPKFVGRTTGIFMVRSLA